MTYAADYTNGTKARSATLTFYKISNGRREFVAQHNVAGKADARKITAANGYTAWNF